MNNPLRSLAKAALKAYARRWADYSRLIPVYDIKTWVIRWEMSELASIARNLNIKTASYFWQPFSTRQAVFLGSQFFLFSDHWFTVPHRIGTAYFHGKPGTGYPEFDELYEKIKKQHEKIHRIQVSHSEMHNLILETGIDPSKVYRIPIGINLDFFPFKEKAACHRLREELGIPQSAVVVGSFQKDGNGAGEGMTPKMIKGPDILIKTLQRVKQAVPELHVLLTGPARGYVKKGLEEANIPYTHTFLKHYPDIGRLYQAIDVYLVTSRQEGGPKAILEAMASGVPLVTTRVGQAMDLVTHGKNGWMVEPEDIDGLANWTEWVLTHPSATVQITESGRLTAEQNSYVNLTHKWNELMRGFVNAS
jgi:glycosyltransferase involved in cell wall biosynthesis